MATPQNSRGRSGQPSASLPPSPTAQPTLAPAQTRPSALPASVCRYSCSAAKDDKLASAISPLGSVYSAPWPNTNLLRATEPPNLTSRASKPSNAILPRQTTTRNCVSNRISSSSHGAQFFSSSFVGLFPGGAHRPTDEIHISAQLHAVVAPRRLRLRGKSHSVQHRIQKIARSIAGKRSPRRFDPCAPGASPSASTRAFSSPNDGTGLPNTPSRDMLAASPAPSSRSVPAAADTIRKPQCAAFNAVSDCDPAIEKFYFRGSAHPRRSALNTLQESAVLSSACNRHIPHRTHPVAPPPQYGCGRARPASRNHRHSHADPVMRMQSDRDKNYLHSKVRRMPYEPEQSRALNRLSRMGRHIRGEPFSQRQNRRHPHHQPRHQQCHGCRPQPSLVQVHIGQLKVPQPSARKQRSENYYPQQRHRSPVLHLGLAAACARTDRNRYFQYDPRPVQSRHSPVIVLPDPRDFPEVYVRFLSQVPVVLTRGVCHTEPVSVFPASQ